MNGRSGISVIIPCHNDGAYLEAALRSVLGQTLAADEIILIDDGSTDETGQVASRFSGDVRAISQPHQGIGSARNAGLRQASGRYIAFLDADDLWPPKSLERRRELCERTGMEAALGMTEEFLSPELGASRFATRTGEGAVAVRLAGAMLIRREVFQRIGGFDAALSVGEWIDWMARFSRAGCGIAQLPDLVLRRRVHAGNLATAIPPQWGDYLTVLRRALHRQAAPGQ